MGSRTAVRKGSAGSIGKLLSRDEVDAVFTEPFIVNGYRQSHTSFAQCVQYAFILHNDVVNFWTHFIPFVVWVVWFLLLAMSWENFFQPFQYPLMCFWAGSCSYALLSSIAHLFSNKSFEVRSVCFMLDYLGIAMYALGADIASSFYINPCSSPFYAHKPLFISVQACMAMAATFFCSLSRFYWSKYRFVIRVSSYVVPYILAVLPFFHRLCVCWMYGTDCVPETTHLHCMAFLFTFLLVFFFISKVPERLAPGRFCIFFQSHQLFHVFSACLTTVQMYFLPIEIGLRQDVLSKVEGTMPTWETTFFPFVCGEIGGLVVVTILGVLVYWGVLTTNKYKKD